MEDLLRSLRGVGLMPPTPSQLLDLLDPEPATQRRLAQLLALERSDQEDVLLTDDLLEGAVHALVENFARAIEREKDLFKREQALLSAPKKIKVTPRKALLARQSAELKRMDAERQTAGPYQPRLILDGGKTYCSTSPLAQLTPIGVADLQAPHRAEGRYLLCRVISDMNIYVGCTFIAEDPAGNAIPVSISHFTASLRETSVSLSKLLPKGTILAIREPYVSLNHTSRVGPCQGKNVTGIRVDTTTDVVVLSRAIEEHESLLASVKWVGQLDDLEHQTQCSWLQDGPLSMCASSKTAFGKKVVEEAMTQGPAQAVSRVRDFVAQERPGAAWREIVAARKLDIAFRGTSTDELLLEAEVLVALEDYIEAQDLLERIAESNDAVQAARESVRERLHEERNGPSDAKLEQIYTSSVQDPTPRHLVGEFVGNVGIKDIDGAGRGLVLTRDVRAGELFLVCRATGSSYPWDPDCKGMPLLRLNLENGVTNTTTQILAATRVQHAIIDRPYLARGFLGLTAGPNLPYSPFVAEPYPLRPARLDKAIPFERRPDIDAAYIDGVLRFNAFGPAVSPKDVQGDSNAQKEGESAPADAAGQEHQAGVRVPDVDGAYAPSPDVELGRSTMPHPLPAILNHSCILNVTSIFLGDVFTSRALHFLPAGTELVHQYVRGEQARAVRLAGLSKHGFVCRCALCTLDERDGQANLDKRARIVAGTLPVTFERSRIVLKPTSGDASTGTQDQQQRQQQDEAHQEAADALEALANEIDATYGPERGPLRPDLFEVWHRAAKHFVGRDREKAMEYERKALRSVCAFPSSDRLPPGFESDVGRSAHSEDLAPEHHMVTRLPDMHFDLATEAMVSIATLLATVDEAASIHWTATAYWAHQCTINGGQAVFLDRWQGSADNAGSVGGPFAPALDLWIRSRRTDN